MSRTNRQPGRSTRTIYKSPRINLSGVRGNFEGIISSTFRGQSREFTQLLGVTLALLVIGLVMVLDASYVGDLSSGKNPFSTAGRQTLIAIIGLVLMAYFSRSKVENLERRAPKFFLAMVAIQWATAFFGVSVGGNRNWISLGPLGNVQPSEFLKIAIIMQVALILTERSDGFHDFKYSWWRATQIPAIGMIAVFWGKDMGTVMVMGVFLIIQLALAGMDAAKVRIYILAALALGVIGTLMSPNRTQRTIAWLQPNAPDPSDINWQAKHGVWALAAGGFGGVGFGKSTMKWSWIPEVDNDYIFAVIGEEFGLIGAAVVILLFVWLAMVLMRIMNRTSDLWSKIVVGGVMGWITFQALVNIGVVLSLLPVLGVPLPMISSGGSSLIANLIAIGIVLSIERQNSRNALPVRRRR